MARETLIFSTNEKFKQFQVQLHKGEMAKRQAVIKDSTNENQL